NYRQLLPEAYEHELTINREELLEVVRRISLMAQKNAPLRLSFSEGEVSISAQTPDVGEASEPVPIPFAGEPFDIGFNPDFLDAGSAGVVRVEVRGRDRDGEHELSVGFQPGEAKRFKVDGAPAERLLDAPHRPLVSVFLPDRLELVKGPPALRRSHLDQVVGAL